MRPPELTPCSDELLMEEDARWLLTAMLAGRPGFVDS